MDVYSRKILTRGISNYMDAQRCKRVLNDAIGKYGLPDIVNSDQVSQYTIALWTQHQIAAILECMSVRMISRNLPHTFETKEGPFLL